MESQQNDRRTRRVGLIALGYWGALFLATHIPRPPVVPIVSASDKLVHFSAFAVLAFLCTWYTSRRFGLSLGRYLALFAGLTVYAALDELLQIPVGRHGDWRDWIADTTGIAAGLAIFAVVRRVRDSSSR